jgi:hypothetical protein
MQSVAAGLVTLQNTWPLVNGRNGTSNLLQILTMA